MQIKDSKGNELVEVIKVDEHTAMEQYHPVTHCLAVVMVGSEYLLGWNRWRKHWEIFGGCIEEGESMRACIERECLEEIGLANLQFEYLGLMHFNLVADYFSAQIRTEYGGLYGIKLIPEDLDKMERFRQDREEIERIALLKDINAEDKIAEIDKELLKTYL